MKCRWCDLEMTDKVSCTHGPYEFSEGQSLPPVPVSQEWANSGFCGDCLAPVGGLHHPGCDAERCPKCGGQLISCECEANF